MHKHLKLYLLISLLLVLVACQDSLPGEEAPMVTRESFTQWVFSASASSQYGFSDWSPQRVIGVPDVSGCVDDSRAWASGRGNGTEWLLLDFRVPVYATEVKVYQTYGRGAISRVTIYDAEENAEVVWEGEDSQGPCPGILSVPIPYKTYRISRVRVDLDESRTGYWNQIDSVELLGFR